jgi:hypothetical protein
MNETELRIWLCAIAVGVWALLIVIGVSMYFGRQDAQTPEPPALSPPEKPQQHWKGHHRS